MRYVNNSYTISSCCAPCSHSQPASLYNDYGRVKHFLMACWCYAVVALLALLKPSCKAQQSDAVSDDVQEVLDPMQPAGVQLPVFMGGQSMGGMLTILSALRDQAAWQVRDFLLFSCLKAACLLPSKDSHRIHARHILH